MVLLPFPVYFLVPGSILIITVGLYSWLKVKKRENLLFFLLAISQAVWAVATFIMWKSCGNDAQVIFWDRVLYFATTFTIPLLFHFTMEACDLAGNRRNKIFILLAYVIGFFFSYLSTTDYFVNYVFYYKWGCHTYAQVGHHFFFAYVIFFCSAALYKVFKVWRSDKESREKRNKAFFIFFAYLIYALSAVGMLLAYGIAFYPFSYLCFPIFSVIMTYAITEKNFFVSVVATDVLVATILTLNATLFFFPEIEVSFWSKAVIFFLFLVSCALSVKHNHEEIRRKEELERISKLKTEFISIVSHQLRTPLAAVRGYTDMLKDGDYGKVPSKVSGAINYIHDSSVSMIKMVNELLSVTRLERGRIELKIQGFSILDLLDECIRDMELAAGQKGLYLKFIKPKRKLPLVRGDQEKIKHAVSNILNNAVLYTPKGGVTITVTGFPSFVRIEIKDTGMGLDKDELEKIFLSFSRGKRGVELNTQGTGLGLYVAKSFVEMHKGRVVAFSEGRDKGSTFCIDIPYGASIETSQEFKLTPRDMNE